MRTLLVKHNVLNVVRHLVSFLLLSLQKQTIQIQTVFSNLFLIPDFACTCCQKKQLIVMTVNFALANSTEHVFGITLILLCNIPFRVCQNLDNKNWFFIQLKFDVMQMIVKFTLKLFFKRDSKPIKFLYTVQIKLPKKWIFTFLKTSFLK